MTKRVLIIGTSHSEASCAKERFPNGNIKHQQLPKGTRWFDYIENDYDAEVTKLARSGCTATEQYMALASYFKDNPDTYFDLVLVEGRGTEPNMAVPVLEDNATPVEDYDYLTRDRWFYDSWQDQEYQLTQHNTERRYWGRLSPHEIPDQWLDRNNPNHYLVKYMETYLLSDLHHIENLTINYALCKLAKTKSSLVKWFTFTFVEFEKKPWVLDMYLDQLGSHIIDRDRFVSNPEISIQSDEWSSGNDRDNKCLCGHMNERGHADFWQNRIKPYLQEIFNNSD